MRCKARLLSPLFYFFFLGSNKSLIQNAQRLIKKSVDNHMNQWPCASQELLQGSSLRISQKPRQQSALLRKKKHSHRYIDNALIRSGIKAIFLKILDSWYSVIITSFSVISKKKNKDRYRWKCYTITLYFLLWNITSTSTQVL